MITELLKKWQSGDCGAESELIGLVYPTLLELARVQVRRNSGVLTLQKTELAHEAFERLRVQQRVDWQSREHFYAICATVIRRVVVDYLRERSAEKRGGRMPFVPLSTLHEDDQPLSEKSVDWIAVDQALTELSTIDQDCAKVVELKFFSGLSSEQIASLMKSSVATVGRQWRFARAWLAQNLASQDS